MATINVQRFIDIQDEYNHYETALKEIKDGRKLSHWIWYIFPQIKGLGHSMMSKTYSIDSLLEAKAYWENDILHARLKETTEALLSHTDDSAEFIFGGLDARKVKSCMTLFDVVSPHDIFENVLDTFYEGGRCRRTLSKLKEETQEETDEQSDTSEAKRIYNEIARPAYTPNRLSVLKPDEVFVFGSNLNGYHGGGAARAAMNKFGAEWGKGVGLQGQSYAIPTMQGGVETIQPYVDDFIAFAKRHEELFFYVTRIGCGIAGFTDEDIAPLFAAAQYVENICLPKSFAEIVKLTFPKEMRQMMYGQMRTLVDMLKAINKAKPIIDARDAMAEVHGVLERNVRYSDEFAFMAWRTIRCVLGKYDHDGCPIDFEKLEKDMYDFHKGNGHLVEDTLQDVMYRYSACKMVKYIQFLNEFRRYKSYDEISNDLTSIPFSHCSSNEPNYYFSFGQFPLYVLQSILRDEWKNIAPHGILDNDSLEEIMMGRYQKALAEYGICELIRRSYGDVGCHPDIQGPKIYDVDEPVYGPYFRIDGKLLEKGCSDFRRFPFNSQEFEMQFASGLLDKDENYIHVGEGRWNEYYIPRQDTTLPVYSRIKGKLHFDTEEEKLTFIEQQGRNAR